MKKQFLYFIIVLALFSFPCLTLAQEPGTAQEPGSEIQYTNEERVDILCDCVNSLMDPLHPQIKVMIRDIEGLGEEKAMEKFTNYLLENPDEAEQIAMDGKTLQKFDQSIAEIEGCSTLNSILSDANIKDDPATEEEFKTLLESKSNCELAQIFFRLGTQE